MLQNQNEVSLSLIPYSGLYVRQIHELGEWIGFETRNKYLISDESGRQVGFAAEQNKGLLGFLLRQVLGHWRRFDIRFFTADRREFMHAHHPFRFLFQRLEVSDVHGRRLGAIQQRFSLLAKKFDVENAQGLMLMQVSSPVWRIWTFPFVKNGRQVATVSKKWSGILSEALTDRDNFRIQIEDPNLGESERQLLLAAAVFIDLMYFEKKAD